jgi:hypothetical protein
MILFSCNVLIQWRSDKGSVPTSTEKERTASEKLEVVKEQSRERAKIRKNETNTTAPGTETPEAVRSLPARQVPVSVRADCSYSMIQ